MLVPLKSPEGAIRLEEAGRESGCVVQHEFVESFRKQRGNSVCGLASLAVLLTAREKSLSKAFPSPQLSNQLPEVIDRDSSCVDEDDVYPMAARNVATSAHATDGIIVSEKKIRSSGMTLDQLRALAEALPTTEKAMTYFPAIRGSEKDTEVSAAAAATTLATKTTAQILDGPESLRQLVVEVLSEPSWKCGLVLNYHMSTLGQVPFGGHLSPVAAYHAASDSLLVLDVWHTTTEPIWAPLDGCAGGGDNDNGCGSVWEAISGIDPKSGAPRGVLRLEHLPPKAESV